MRRNTDETQRDLERLARDGDRRAALRLLASWERTGEVGFGPILVPAEMNHDWLGRVELVFTFPSADGVKKDVRYTMTFRDVPRHGMRTHGFVVNGSAYGVDDLAETLADLGSIARIANVNDVVALTKKRGVIDIASIRWPEQVRSDIPGYGGSFEEVHEVVRLVLDEFWSDPSYRAKLIEALMKSRLAYRASKLDQIRRQFEGLEEEAALAVEDELDRREGKLDFTPREEGSEEDEEARSRAYARELERHRRREGET